MLKIHEFRPEIVENTFGCALNCQIYSDLLN